MADKGVFFSEGQLKHAGKLRPSQIVTAFGPGAIYDVQGDSVMIKGIDYWSNKYYTVIQDPRLRERLKKINRFRKVKSFRNPSFNEEKEIHKNISVITFPRWGECPDCNKLSKRNGDPRFENLSCHNCKNNEGKSPKTHPARLVVACKKGHIDDFPWKEWVNHTKNDCRNDSLYLVKGAESMGLGGLAVLCKNCNSSRDLGSALSKNGMKGILNYCSGNRPWLEDNQPCDEMPRGLLKGASNVYFSYVLRGLSIPPFVDPLNDILQTYWDAILVLRNKPTLINSLVEEIVQNDEEVRNRSITKKEIMDYFQKCFDATEEHALNKDIKADEWISLNRSVPQDYRDFVTEIVEVPRKFMNSVDRMAVVRKLQETVVLKGFSRIDAYDADDPNMGKISPLSGTEPTWLPAVQNRGEGIFISFKENIVSNWERLDSVSARTERILKQYNDVRKSKSLEAKSLPPRFIALHSIAHVLIRELSNFAGYSTASIRERIYGDNEMAGILLYTSSASSDGSLGGLVEIGKTSAFKLLLDQAVKKSRFCSSDPLCSAHDPHTSSRDNGAACHACCFLPETSCEMRNSLLDRAMIYSTIANTDQSSTMPGLLSYAASKQN